MDKTKITNDLTSLRMLAAMLFQAPVQIVGDPNISFALIAFYDIQSDHAIEEFGAWGGNRTRTHTRCKGF